MSQTPTYWRRVKLRLIEGAIAYAEVLEGGAVEGDHDGRALTTTYSRWTMDLFEIGPRNIAAIVERDIARSNHGVTAEVRKAKEALVAAARALVQVKSLCNDPDDARRQIWGKANNAYEDALEALGPRQIAALLQRDISHRGPPTAVRLATRETRRPEPARLD